MGEKEIPAQESPESATATPEISNAKLAELYQGGLNLTEIAAATGLGRFAVAYRLRKAGVERRNRGSPRKTAAEKSDFAKQQLAATFGESLPAVTESLTTGKTTVKALAVEKGIKPSTLATQLRRAKVEIPKERLKPAPRPVSRITILDLIDPRDAQMALGILTIFADLRLDPQRVVTATDRYLKILGFTPQQILYMRGQLRKNRGTSP